MTAYRLYNGGSINLEIGPGPAAAHDDNFYYDSLQDPNQYATDPTWGRYRGEWQMQYYKGGNGERGSSYFQKAIQVSNNSGYDVFIPSNSSDENKSVFYHIKESSGVTTTQGVYGALYSTIVNDGVNTVPGLWSDSSGYLRADTAQSGDNYAGGGIHCWQNNGDWSYYGASPLTTPPNCPSGFTNNGVYSGFYAGNDMRSVTTYDNSGNYYSYGPFIDSRGYSWNSYQGSTYPHSFIYPNWFGSPTYAKHDNSLLGKFGVEIYGNSMPYFGWTWLMAFYGNTYGHNSQSQVYGCYQGYPYSAGAVRLCRKYANNSYTSV